MRIENLEFYVAPEVDVIACSVEQYVMTGSGNIDDGSDGDYDED